MAVTNPQRLTASGDTDDGGVTRNTPGDVGPQGSLVTPSDPRVQVRGQMEALTGDKRGTVMAEDWRGGGMLGGYGFNEDVDPTPQRGGNTLGNTGGVAPTGRVKQALSQTPRRSDA